MLFSETCFPLKFSSATAAIKNQSTAAQSQSSPLNCNSSRLLPYSCRRNKYYFRSNQPFGNPWTTPIDQSQLMMAVLSTPPPNSLFSPRHRSPNRRRLGSFKTNGTATTCANSERLTDGPSDESIHGCAKKLTDKGPRQPQHHCGTQCEQKICHAPRSNDGVVYHDEADELSCCDLNRSNFGIEDLSPLSSSSSSSPPSSLQQTIGLEEDGHFDALSSCRTSREITLQRQDEEEEPSQWYEGLSPLSTESITSTKLNSFATSSEFGLNNKSCYLLPPHPASLPFNPQYQFNPPAIRSPCHTGWHTVQDCWNNPYGKQPPITSYRGGGQPNYLQHDYTNNNSDLFSAGLAASCVYDYPERIVAGRPLTSPRRADVQGIPILPSPRNNFYFLNHEQHAPPHAKKNSNSQFDELILPVKSKLTGVDTPHQSKMHRSASIVSMGTLSTSTAGDIRPARSPESIATLEKDTSFDHLAECLLPARLLTIAKSDRQHDQMTTALAGTEESLEKQQPGARVAFILQIMICWRCRLLYDTTASSQMPMANTSEATTNYSLKVSSLSRSRPSQSPLLCGSGSLAKMMGTADSRVHHIQGQSWAQILEEEFLTSSNRNQSKIYWIQPTSFDNAECYSKVLCTSPTSSSSSSAGSNALDAEIYLNLPADVEELKPANWDLFEKMCTCSSAEYSEFTGALTVISDLVADLLADREERCSKCDEQYPLPIIICHDQNLTTKFANIDFHNHPYEKSFDIVTRHPISSQQGAVTHYNASGVPMSYSSIRSTVDTIWGSRTLPNSPVGSCGSAAVAGSSYTKTKQDGPKQSVWNGVNSQLFNSNKYHQHARGGSGVSRESGNFSSTAGMTSSLSAPNFHALPLMMHYTDSAKDGGNSNNNSGRHQPRPYKKPMKSAHHSKR